MVRFYGELVVVSDFLLKPLIKTCSSKGANTLANLSNSDVLFGVDHNFLLVLHGDHSCVAVRLQILGGKSAKSESLRRDMDRMTSKR